ncbi:MAG: hypothetical protein JNK72_06080 [Myxococcales bacterium]|nr:hypothetical protein [Myxococcales bacterium]
MPRPHWRWVFTLLLLGCGDETGSPKSYDRCNPGDLCGLGTACLRAPFTAGPRPLTLCTYSCQSDTDCPGFSARCVLGDDGSGPVTRCVRSCDDDDDCRAGTRCRRVSTAQGVASYCVPEEGDRACTQTADCAPFLASCESGRCAWR